MARRMTTFLLLAGLILVLAASPALGAKGEKNGGGKLTATISIMDEPAPATALDGAGPSDVSFELTRSKLDTKDTIWVTNKCYDADGTMLSRRDFAVIWGWWDSFEGYAGPFETTGAMCTAYATLRPWQDRVLGNAILTYTP